MEREAKVGSSTMKCRGDFISREASGLPFPSAAPSGAQGDCHHLHRALLQPSLAQSPGLFVCRADEEEGGIRERAGGRASAAELIKSFEGDGELSQVHIKRQGNEC